jgi:hypothetical protein
MTTYKEVFQLAQSKGYDSILCTMARYGGSATLPHNVTDAASELCELTLIQKWLLTNHKIHICITVVPDNRWGWIHYYLNKIEKFEKGFELYEKDRNYEAIHTYEQALLEGINEALKLI